MNQLPHKAITERIIGCAFTVHRKPGFGFLDKVYENAMVIELKKCGLSVQQQAPVTVHYDGHSIGEYFVDLLVESKIICELKANITFAPEHEVRLVNYLVATGLDVGLLLNFGKNVTVKRKYREYAEPSLDVSLSTDSN